MAEGKESLGDVTIWWEDFGDRMNPTVLLVMGANAQAVFWPMPLVEALVDAAVNIGLHHEMAEELALQTVLGAACLARETGKQPKDLRDMVTSPGGTTAAGLAKLEDGGLRDLLMSAVIAAHERARELGR